MMPLLRHPEVRAKRASKGDGIGLVILRGPRFARPPQDDEVAPWPAAQKFIGRSVPRLEDRPLLTGQGRFAADINFPGQWIMRVVRSPVAHGKHQIDRCKRGAGAARRARGVDLRRRRAHPADRLPPHRAHRARALPAAGAGAATSCAMSASRSRRCSRTIAYVAEDAADLVELDIEPLPPIIVRHRRNRASTKQTARTEPDVDPQKAYGDVEAAFAGAMRWSSSILPSAAIPACRWKRAAPSRATTKRATCWKCTAPPRCRTGTATRSRTCSGRKPESVQLYEGHVGGGFGIRGEIYPEDVLVCAAALAFRKPIKWIEDRREHLIAANHSRQQRHQIRAAIDGEGRILAIDDEFFHDNGAYMRTHAATVPDLAAAMLPGPYRVPAYRATGHIRLTNKTPCGTYRAPGRYESTFVRERLLDAIAAHVGRRPGRDPPPQSDRQERHALRARPRHARHAHRLRQRRLRAAARQGAARRPAGTNCRTQSQARRAKGEKVGAGLALFVEKSGLGPFDKVRIEAKPDGAIEVVTGVASVGQGVETAMAQICADTLGVDYADDARHPRPDRPHRHAAWAPLPRASR